MSCVGNSTLPHGIGYWLPEDAHLQLHEIRELRAFFGQLIERRPDDDGETMALPLGRLSRC